MFFDIFDDDNDARVTTTEIMEFGKKRNMQGLLPNSSLPIVVFNLLTNVWNKQRNVEPIRNFTWELWNHGLPNC